MKIPLFSKKQEMAEDPVCHMQVDISNPPGGTAEHNGLTYYFCGPGCRVAFQKEPEAYLSGEKHMDMGVHGGHQEGHAEGHHESHHGAGGHHSH